MSQCRAMLEVSEEFVQAICVARLDRPFDEDEHEPITRNSDRKGHILVRCGRQEGECDDAWGHLIWLSGQPCGGEFHSYLEEGA